MSYKTINEYEIGKNKIDLVVKACFRPCKTDEQCALIWIIEDLVLPSKFIEYSEEDMKQYILDAIKTKERGNVQILVT